MRVAVLGPGGVGGLLAAVLARGGEDVLVVARETTAGRIAEHGIDVRSVTFGDFLARPRATARLEEEVDALIVATKWGGLEPALERIAVAPALVLPQLNGLDHMAVLRERFEPQTVLAGSIRVEADRPAPGAVVHTSPFLLVSMASAHAGAEAGMRALAGVLERLDVAVRVEMPIGAAAEAQVLWSKLIRLNALACTTSAHDVLLGTIRTTPALRAELVGAIEEASAVARAEGAPEVSAERAVAELERAHATLGSSMQRDIAAGREPELDAIAGSVLRAAARHGIACPTIEGLVAAIAARAGVAPPRVTG